MRFQLLSDLHLERDPAFCPTYADGADVLILAGDVGSYQAGSRLRSDDFGLGRFAPSETAWQRVIFVPGNHEYDQLDFEETHDRLKQTCQRLGITFLERSELVLDSTIRVLGTTLWSDFDALASLPPIPKSEAQIAQLRSKAFRAANFYLRKFSTLKEGAPMLAEEMRELALSCQSWLRDGLSKPFDGKTLVITHFAPSLRSADPRYGITPGTAGFCNALDELFSNVDVWVHGHLHCPNSYRVGNCRIVSNSLGYIDKGEQTGFIREFVFDL